MVICIVRDTLFDPIVDLLGYTENENYSVYQGEFNSPSRWNWAKPELSEEEETSEEEDDDDDDEGEEQVYR